MCPPRLRPAPIPRSAFAGFCFPPDAIILAVRWYLGFALSYRDVEELLAERRIQVDHTTVYRWVQRFTPLLAETARPCRHLVGDRWQVDETYVKVTGQWRYVYRAIDIECDHGRLKARLRPMRAVFDWRCAACPLRPRCTRAKDGKTFNLSPYEAELAHARRQATTPAFQASYRRWRPMVERSIAWLVAGHNRRLRYRGLDRNALWLGLRVAAINLRRLLNLGLACTQTGWTLV
jgi:Transposase DDE domain